YVNQRVLIFKPIGALVDKNYLFYCLLKNDFKNFILNYVDSETAQANISATTVGLYSCTIPNLQTQQKIAKILSSLDEKIELNNKINENLHAQAQTIFKSWFVDFEPFGGTMPSDWEEKSLVQLADFVNGLAMQKFRPKENEIGLPVLKIRELRLGNCDLSSEFCTPTIEPEYIVNQGDIIFSWSGSLVVDVWSGKQCGLNQHLFNVKPKEFYGKWFVFMWVQYHLDNFIAIANDKATTMGHIKREHLEKAKVFVPAQKEYQQLDNLLNPILEYSLNLRIENKKLAQIRDTLLPKLMSGKLEV
ncbi:restriction endonuclease subunit S, partial [Helicobacter ganmani]|uniref:restriction endonuclease subunit S n=1 Tax=Helicobacter ganmani TaxID=60246 RepID=UPI003A85542B